MWWRRRDISVKFGQKFISELGRTQLAEHIVIIFNNKFDSIWWSSYPKARYVGVYKVEGPALLIRDLDLIKDVLVTKFNIFNKNEFALDPEVWTDICLMLIPHLKSSYLPSSDWSIDFCESVSHSRRRVEKNSQSIVAAVSATPNSNCDSTHQQCMQNDDWVYRMWARVIKKFRVWRQRSEQSFESTHNVDMSRHKLISIWRFFVACSKIHDRRRCGRCIQSRWTIVYKSKCWLASNWRRNFQANIYRRPETADFSIHAVHGEDLESWVRVYGLKIEKNRICFHCN